MKQFIFVFQAFLQNIRLNHAALIGIFFLIPPFVSLNHHAGNQFSTTVFEQDFIKGECKYSSDKEIIIKADCMEVFREILYKKDEYEWLEKCIVASPLGSYTETDTIGYFGFLYDYKPFRFARVNAHVICRAELKNETPQLMTLSLKKETPEEVIINEWQDTVKANKTVARHFVIKLKEFEALWTFSQQTDGNFEVKLTACLTPPADWLASIKEKNLQAFVDSVVVGTLNNLEAKIASQFIQETKKK